MDARALLIALFAALDEHRWDDLPALLHPDFACRLVHTGEVFDRDAWVRFNREYPGFERLRTEDVVAGGRRAAGRAHVTGIVDGATAHYGVASFVTALDGRIVELVEVWTDMGGTPPDGTRPA